MAATRESGWAGSAAGAATLVVAAVVAAGAIGGAAAPAWAQDTAGREISISPAYEGWERNDDGSFNLVFGYMNRNMDEHVHVPIGPDNILEPGDIDQGQPTYFLPRRNRYIFRIVVPYDFGEKEIVWTLTAHGKTEKAYGSLKPDYVIDDLLRMKDIGGLGVKEIERQNRAPEVHVEGAAERTVGLGQPLALTAVARDDGVPEPKPAASRTPVNYNAWGLRVAWFVYRGPGNQVSFEPEQFKVYTDYRGNSPWTPGWAPPPVPADGQFPVTATFAAPGKYVLRAMAHDGGLITNADVTVTVTE
jgi:hypothetical protein